MLVSVLFIAFAGAAGAESAAVTARGMLEDREIPFHRVTRYRITVEAPAGAEIAVAPWDGEHPDLHVTRETPEVTLLPDDRQRVEQVIVLAPVRPRRYVLPETVVLVDGAPAETLDPGELNVRALTSEERAEIAEPEGLITLADLQESSRTAYWPLVLGGLLVLAVAGGAAMWYRAGRPLPGLSRTPGPLENALNRLAAVERELEAGTAGCETVYVTVSSVLREYIEARYGVTIRELSTPEFVAGSLPDLPVPPEQLAPVRKLLVEADRVKFARHLPGEAAQAHAIETVRGIVNALAEEAPAPEAVDTRGAA